MVNHRAGGEGMVGAGIGLYIWTLLAAALGKLVHDHAKRDTLAQSSIEARLTRQA